ncbi:MAG: dihydroneopterin aldolase [Acidobacteria bacterium 13_1_20CM_2_55_15]|nr:MAG: dihydroneopterin aldolase [Acidobacteria bacterium 13_1_20CM_2_55_15]PYR64653.1 MAG: dihydroneopterin aldolase [Acidobacteriota bacterium]
MTNRMDRILIAGIDCVAAIGVTPEERTMKQRLSIDVEIATDISQAARSDSLKDALDYSKVATVVTEVCRSRDFHLIETVAELLAGRILAEFLAPRVRILVRKISPVLEPRVNYVSVEIVRSR